MTEFLAQKSSDNTR